MIDFQIHGRVFGDTYLIWTPWRSLHYFCTALYSGASYGDKECYYTYHRLMQLPAMWDRNQL